MIPFKNDVPTRRKPFVTVGLIAINCLVFIYQVSLPEKETLDLIYLFGAVPAVVTHFPAWGLTGTNHPALTLVSSMFLHGGLIHLLGNMLYLWIFGNNVEDSMGHLRFIVFYLACGLIAAAAQVFNAPHSEIPMIGASGAISGVLGAYLVIHPFARVHTLIFIFIFIRVVTLPAIIVLGIWFLLQIMSSLYIAPDAAGVAWMAHIGGFIAGMILISFFQKSHRRRFRKNSIF
ncbi:MAG: rhomboid family intramembrane serine protease [Gemmatimonadota bacterium]|nr:rhomboid family intramembrane serine protease [Gemmatimonadota bacterium]